MADVLTRSPRLSREEIAAAREGRLQAQALQLIESNPLSTDEVAMFEMFEREGWDHERSRRYILDLIETGSAQPTS